MKRVLRGILPVAALIALFANGCLWQAVSGLPCPGCGVTRAWLCALAGDFHQAMRLNAFFIPLTVMVPVVVGYMWLDRAMPRWLRVGLYVVAGGAFLYNLLRIFRIVPRP